MAYLRLIGPHHVALSSKNYTGLTGGLRHQSLSLTLVPLWSLATRAALCSSCTGTTGEGCTWTGTRCALPEVGKELAQETARSGEENTSGLHGHQLYSPDFITKAQL